MIIDKDENIIEYWADYHRNLLIQGRPGNGRTDKAKEIINYMINLDHSFLILDTTASTWLHGLNESLTGWITRYDAIKTYAKIKTDLLVIGDLRTIPDNFDISVIEYKHLLIISDERTKPPAFFNGGTVRLINWNNVSSITFNDEKDLAYTATSNNDNQTMSLATKNLNTNECTEIEFPMGALKKLLLE